ncbi:MAG: hypothetical protein H6744_01585 [Deltaproteobacteria bacterium]|nr:hypothetical protein [Deltaproteobacteria bacterium]
MEPIPSTTACYTEELGGRHYLIAELQTEQAPAPVQTEGVTVAPGHFATLSDHRGGGNRPATLTQVPTDRFRGTAVRVAFARDMARMGMDL